VLYAKFSTPHLSFQKQKKRCAPALVIKGSDGVDRPPEKLLFETGGVAWARRLGQYAEEDTQANNEARTNGGRLFFRLQPARRGRACLDHYRSKAEHPSTTHLLPAESE